MSEGEEESGEGSGGGGYEALVDHKYDDRLAHQ